MKPIETEEEYRQAFSDFKEATFVGMSEATVRELAEAIEAYEKIHYPIANPTREEWEKFQREEHAPEFRLPYPGDKK